MKTIIFSALFVGLFISASLPSFAQTNSTNLPAEPAANMSSGNQKPSPEWMDKTAGDISEVFSDFGIPVSKSEIQGIGALIVLSFFGSRGLRKAIPDQWQTGTLGKVLGHLALEVNPQPGQIQTKPQPTPTS